MSEPRQEPTRVSTNAATPAPGEAITRRQQPAQRVDRRPIGPAVDARRAKMSLECRDGFPRRLIVASGQLNRVPVGGQSALQRTNRRAVRLVLKIGARG